MMSHNEAVTWPIEQRLNRVYLVFFFYRVFSGSLKTTCGLTAPPPTMWTEFFYTEFFYRVFFCLCRVFIGPQGELLSTRPPKHLLPSFFFSWHSRHFMKSLSTSYLILIFFKCFFLGGGVLSFTIIWTICLFVFYVFFPLDTDLFRYSINFDGINAQSRAERVWERK